MWSLGAPVPGGGSGHRGGVWKNAEGMQWVDMAQVGRSRLQDSSHAVRIIRR